MAQDGLLLKYKISKKADVTTNIAKPKLTKIGSYCKAGLCNMSFILHGCSTTSTIVCHYAGKPALVSYRPMPLLQLTLTLTQNPIFSLLLHKNIPFASGNNKLQMTLNSKEVRDFLCLECQNWQRTDTLIIYTTC